MKTNFRNMFTKIVALVIIAAFSFSNVGFAAEISWNKGQKINFVPTKGAQTYTSSTWTKSLVDSYKLTWYEKPNRQVLKGEFMLVQLRTIQESLKRRGLNQLSASKETLNFKDINTLTASAQEEAKILKSLGILNGNASGYLKMSNPINRAEAAKVLYYANEQVLKITPYKAIIEYKDINGNWAKEMIKYVGSIGLLKGGTNKLFSPNDPLTLEQVLQILENEIGHYSNIEKTDIAKAINQTFKVTVDSKLLNNEPLKDLYTKYEKKMKTFGLDQLYNNKSAKTSEFVTKAEALKLAIAVAFNVSDISGFAEQHNEYDNAIWVEFAKYHVITDEDINITNYNNKATYMDVISYFEKCKLKFLKEQPVKDTTVNLNDISKYSSEQQAAIKDMMANGIIYPLTASLNGDTSITKGQLNEIVVNFAEKYNTIAMKGDTINTDPNTMPSNVDKYPYTLTNVDKAIYEIPFTIEYEPDSRTPEELYVLKKEIYSQAKSYSEGFFDSILNIDYRTITEESFQKQIEPYLISPANKSAIKFYVKYVKDNEIVLEGKSSLQVPIIYFDGFTFRPRLNLKFEVKHSKTKENLLYLDFFENSNKIYAKTSYDFLVDYYLTNPVFSSRMCLIENELYKTILLKDKCGITRKMMD